MKQVGFVGASGLMGHGIAKNVQAAGYPLTFTQRKESERTADLLAAGATVAPDYPTLAANSDVVILCVTASNDVEEVVTGLLSGGNAREGLIVVDTSTSEPSSTARLAAQCAAAGVRFVDAPLTLGPAQAEAGTLNVLVGADEALYQELLPLIETFAGNIFHCGGVGSAHAVKLLNNFVVHAPIAALAEAYAVAAKQGIDPKVLQDVLNVGSLKSLLLDNIGKSLYGDYTGMQFALGNARKDMRYYSRLAGELGVPPLIGDGVHEAFAIAVALGYGESFVPSIVEAAQKLNDVEIRAHDAE